MTVAALFWVLVAVSCGYAALYGGQTGRLVAAAYLAAVILTVPAQLLQRSWDATNWPTLFVDFLLLIALVHISLRTKHFWPIWIAGFHIVTITTHLGAAIAPSFGAKVYFALANLWVIPKLGMLVIGVTIDRNLSREWRCDDVPLPRRNR